MKRRKAVSARVTVARARDRVSMAILEFLKAKYGPHAPLSDITPDDVESMKTISAAADRMERSGT